ncbi:DUF4238 domain-containing protein [Priestia megaterium]|uniref:DUF4238 domain-containing protein n=1 Tax=Priestia megaterium TaxID=1404 RepID=UPI00406BB236
MTSNAKYHHLIPQTYMRLWGHNNNSIYIAYKGKVDEFIERNTMNISGINHYHSVKVGMAICTEDDCKQIFQPLDGFKVIYEDKEITEALEMNKLFFDFDEWKIYYPNASPISRAKKNELKQQINGIHIKDIEEKWGAKFENEWNKVVEDISQHISKESNGVIPALHKEFLINFIVSMDWRSESLNPSFKRAMDQIPIFKEEFEKIEIPKNERIYPFLKTAYDEMEHELVLKKFREFFESNGIMSQTSDKLRNKFSLSFIVADKDLEFITSDNPSFQFNNSQGVSEWIFPISPKILCKLVKSKKLNQYNIEYSSIELTKGYNEIIKNNCTNFIIARENNKNYF